MTELRSVDPRTLKPSTTNTRTVPVPPQMDAELLASIRAIGIIQPPVVREYEGELIIKVGHRRVKAAIEADLSTIDVLVKNSEASVTQMMSLSENAHRAPPHPVDIWRGVKQLEDLGWNEQSIADALALTVRIVRRVKLLAHIHEPMLGAMTRGRMPSEDELRLIANASLEEQAQVWKKHKPKKNEDAAWYSIARALSKRRIPFSAAKFDDVLAAQYGVTWLDDLFAPADEDTRYTTDVEGFFGAQQEWLENNLPKAGVVIPVDEYGQAALPKKAERVYGKLGKGDSIGHFLDPRTAEVKTVAFRMPQDKKATKGKGQVDAPVELPPKAQRPDVTQKGLAIIGDLRTDALHEALKADPIDDVKLIGLLVLALGGRNVVVQSGLNAGGADRTDICDRLSPDGTLTLDDDVIRTAARDMLTQVLSCRENMSNSGLVARVAGETIGASLRLPSMATDEFLSCLSRQALEREAAANQVRVEVRVKDTRAGVVKHFAGATWHYPDAVFAISAAERDAESVGGRQWVPGLSAGEDGAEPADGAEDLSEDGSAQDEVDDESTYSVAA
ncbi:ParB/RepB/Spo0J family partition protein [Acidisoma cellulosilytica]|uniref:ParB/RepB/Spo0J family partition protein n=1 Tax=Acidisoma cellulosilyticum TaxID=2802395 RepID=A0A964E5U8_9PROT|nr:ParB/RepB/Spo0J family partition protein [Acidisoma cellulosilyticum]MCB8882914.1 ParB/RepB/Spo0J family partition protein [Acidisoma cellulosilyticum]